MGSGIPSYPYRATARIRGSDPCERPAETSEDENVPSILEALLKRGQAQGRDGTCIEVMTLMA